MRRCEIVHLMRLKQTVFDPTFKMRFEAGRWYLAETQNAIPMFPGQPSALQARFPDAELIPLRWEEHGFRVVPRYDDPNEKVWIIRAGGYGDLFYLMPVVAAIARRLHDPQEQLTLQTAMESFPTRIPLRFFPFPSPLDDLDREAAILNMEDIPGELEDDHAGSSTARYALRAGLRERDLVFDADEWLPLAELKRRGDALWQSWFGQRRPRIVVALTASAATRSVPAAFQIASALALHAAIYFVAPIAHPTPFPAGLLSDPADWIGVVVAADGVIGADTAPTHLSILLQKPTLAVFGAIPSVLRIPERYRSADWLTILDVFKQSPCPCKLNRPVCPISLQPFCFALAAKQEELFRQALEFVRSLR
jgi:hypothetical protein